MYFNKIMIMKKKSYIFIYYILFLILKISYLYLIAIYCFENDYDIFSY